MVLQEKTIVRSGVTRPPGRPLSRRKGRLTRPLARMLTYTLLILLSLIFLAPIGWMFSTALKTLGDVARFPPALIPSPVVWSNFATAVTAVPFLQYMANSTAYVALALIGDVFSSAFIAYGFACLRFRYREAIFLCVLMTMMVPYEVQLLPQFILFKGLGWINTYLPLIVPTFFGSPYLIFLLRQAFRAIPRELLEAARIDGAGYLMIWWRFILPLSKPALAAVAIFSFMFHWNDFTGPLVYLNSNELYPVSLGLAQYTAAYGGTLWNLLMAASLVAVLPCVVIFFIAQRQLIANILIGGARKGGEQSSEA